MKVNNLFQSKDTHQAKSEKDVINALLSISKLVISDLKLVDLFSEIHQIINNVVTVKNIAIAQVDIENDEMYLSYFVDEKDGSVYQGKSIKIGNGLSSYALKHPQPINLNKTDILKLQENGTIDQILGTMCTSWVGVPILYEEEILGLVIVQSYDESFIYDARDVEVLTFVGASISNVFKQKQIAEEEKRLKDELIQKEKMASLGGLVAGVAHEINTPLGVCVTGISNLLNEHDKFLVSVEAQNVTESQFNEFIEDVGETCEIVKSNVERAAKLISSFKQIAVDQSSETNRDVNILGYLNEIVTSLNPMVKKTQHDIEINCAPDLVLNTKAGALSQLFTNLITNSIIHGFEEITKGRILINVEQNTKQTTFSYTDNGKGMSAEHTTKFFEPFFTTKRNSGGSGLGGHIIYNIVTSLGGSVKLRSELGQGIKITFTIPNQL